MVSRKTERVYCRPTKGKVLRLGSVAMYVYKLLRLYVNQRVAALPSDILCGSGCCAVGWAVDWNPGGGFCVVGQPAESEEHT